MSAVKQVIVVRADLGMSRGKMAAQACHAAIGSLRLGRWALEIDAWIETGETTVVLRVDSEAELLALAAACSEQDLPHYLVRDEGRTEFGGVPTYTCLGIGPANSAEIDLVTGKLPCFR